MTVAELLSPTRRKLALTAGGFLLFPVLVLLRRIPSRWDLLDLREVSELILYLMLGFPIRLFDVLTGSAFVSRGEGFIRFPSTIQLAAAALANALFFYLLACAWVRWRTRAQRQGSTR